MKKKTKIGTIPNHDFTLPVKIKDSSENDAFSLFKEGNYQKAYEMLQELEKSTDTRTDKGKIYFTLGFILEFNLTRDRNIKLPKLSSVIEEYYNKAIQAGCISAQARKCFVNEKNGGAEAQEQYEKLISNYENGSKDLLNQLKDHSKLQELENCTTLLKTLQEKKSFLKKLENGSEYINKILANLNLLNTLENDIDQLKVIISNEKDYIKCLENLTQNIPFLEELVNNIEQLTKQLALPNPWIKGFVKTTLSNNSKKIDDSEKIKLLDKLKEHVNSVKGLIEQAKSIKEMAENAAFANFRLGRIAERESNTQEALAYYDNALTIYNEFGIENLDHARVLNRIGWIKSAEFAEMPKKYRTKKEFDDDTKEIASYFVKAKKFGLPKAELGKLNLEVLLYVLINKNVSFEPLKLKIDKVLKCYPNNQKTLLNRAKIAIIAPNDNGTFAFNLIRKVLTINPDNKEGKKLLSELCIYQTRFLGQRFHKSVLKEIKGIFHAASQKNAAPEIIEQASRIRESFNLDGYMKQAWFNNKIFYPKKSMDKYLKYQASKLTIVIMKALNESEVFKTQYMPENMEIVAKQLTKILLSNNPDYTSNSDLIREILAKEMSKENYVRFAALIEESLKQTCIQEVQSKLIMSKEEYELTDAKTRFKELLCERFRLGRNSIEAIAGGRALPLPDKIDNIKYILDRSLMIMNIPPLSYLGNLLGGNALIYLGGALATDAAYKLYKEMIINANKEVNEMLPTGMDAIKLMETIAEKLANQYGSQLANIKDNRSMEDLVKTAEERMMNHLFAQTSTIKKVTNFIKDKINPINWLWDIEPVPVVPEKILLEGVINGKSNDQKRFLHTKVIEDRYGKDWVADGVLGKSGVITDDGRIWGTVHNITKYGCIIGTEDDAKMRGLSPVKHEELPSELVEMIIKSRENQIKSQEKLNKIENPSANKKPEMQAKPSISQTNNHKFIKMGLAVAGTSILFLVAPEIPIISSFVPRTLSSLMAMVSIVFKLWPTSSAPSMIRHGKVEEVKCETTEPQVMLMKEKVKGPAPRWVDRINNLNNVGEIGRGVIG